MDIDMALGIDRIEITRFDYRTSLGKNVGQSITYRERLQKYLKSRMF